MLWTTFYWSINAQMFGFAVGTFHIVDEQVQIWRAYLGIAIGAIGGSFVWKRMTPRLSGKVDFLEKKWIWFGILSTLVGYFLLISWDGQTATPPEKHYYIATVFMGIAPVYIFANFEIVFSKSLTWQREIVGSHVGMLMAIYGVFGGLGRFLGPFVSGYVMTIGHPTDGKQNCGEWASASSSQFNNLTCGDKATMIGVAPADFCCIS